MTIDKAFPFPSGSPSIVVLSGMSGAGKQLAARYFEDMGWRVVDNLPPRLLPLIVDEHDRGNGNASQIPLCLVCDVRGGHTADLLPAMEILRKSGTAWPILFFLEASDTTLVQRFKETRRTHPLFSEESGILPAITAEREMLSPLRENADFVLDTTGLAPSDLRGLITDAFGDVGAPRQHPLTVTVASFGVKHGTPLDADLLFDVRFLRNPYYVEELRACDGRQPAVERYVMEDERTTAFLDRLYDLVGWSLPHYVQEGKAYLTIAIGCTGGKHRSVVVAEKLSRFLSDRGYRVLTQHRDVDRDRERDGK
ncbi:MAG: RNase adapter RapZ [Armatimonadota bacterium]